MARSEESRHPTPWRDNIEAMTVAIIMAVVLKYFIVEAYKIPTGSMQPTLMGQPEDKNRDGLADGGIFDRILVDKLSYRFRNPERYEVVIFKYPLDRSKNFVKRLVGLPGEELRIHRGDLWTRADSGDEWEVLRRSKNVQLETWKPMDVAAAQKKQALWKADDDGAARWSMDGRKIDARSPGVARFVGDGAALDSIVDSYRHGYSASVLGIVHRSANRDQQLPVGDLRVTGEVQASAECESLVVEIDESTLRHRFEIPGPAAPAGATPRIYSGPGIWAQGETEARGDAWSLSAGRTVSFEAQNIDDLLTLEVDGEVLCELEVPSIDPVRTALRLRVVGGGAQLTDLRAFRDIHYKPSHTGTNEWKIPEEHYFMLGDNTQDSSDSREWAWYEMAWDGPGSEGEAIRGNKRVPEFGRNFAHDSNPIQHASVGEMLTWFRDEWGEQHVFPAASSRVVKAGHPAPFVHRKLITGRALLVFWPLAPHKSLYRLKWIH